MSSENAVQIAVPCGCRLGEGALWDHRTQRLYWVDIVAAAIWWLDGRGETMRRDAPEQVGFVALTPDEDVLVAGLKSGLALIDLRNGRTQPIVSPEPERPGNRINDGTVGPDGSIYFGTMDEREREPSGSFWRYARRRLTRFGDPAVVTNGPAISAKGDLIYTVHSAARKVYVHPLDAGEPGRAELFKLFPDEWGHPDGLAIDAEDHVWICHWGGARITRFRPDASVERVIPIPTAQVTKCAFAGPGLSTLYVTTAQRGRPASDSLAGHVFSLGLDVKGVPAHIAAV